jgi:predicted HicB family RNase H-like nuclease
MQYKGYMARIEYDAVDKIFVGHIAGIKDIVGFHGTSVTALELAFSESVDQYLAACQQLGEQPNKPYSGRMMLRLEPLAHQRIALAAEVKGISINQWASQTLTQAAEFAQMEAMA